MPPVAKIYHPTTPKLARICLTIMNILPQKHWIVLKYIVLIRFSTFIQIKLCNIDTEHVSMYSILVKIGRVKIKHICTRHCAVLCLRAAFKFTTHLITVCSKETYLFYTKVCRWYLVYLNNSAMFTNEYQILKTDE